MRRCRAKVSKKNRAKETSRFSGGARHRNDALDFSGESNLQVSEGDLGKRRATEGFYGVATAPGDLPSGGFASYSGAARAELATTDGGYALEDGTATLVADFASGRVDATLSDFTATSTGLGAEGGAPIDSIELRNMGLSGSGFSGGRIVLSNDGARVPLGAVVGDDRTVASSGSFYGYDDGLRGPDEAAGVLLLQGEDGVLAGGFIVD